jgi:hypothetical protein
VLPACEHAVNQDPKDGTVRDSRGLAHALSGNTAGAIEDFTAAVAWSKENDAYETFGRLREEWIAALRAGQNPFDQAMLAALRMQ